MEKELYGKDEIIEIAMKHGKLNHEFSKTSLEKRLNTILDFLNEERVQTVLEQQRTKKDVGNYFYNKEMNVTRAKIKKTVFDGYNYNVIDAIFLASLVCLFEQPLFKKLRNQVKIKEADQEENNWMKESVTMLQEFEEYWSEKGDGMEWETLALNIESLFYRLTLLPDMSKYAAEIQIKLKSILNTFDPLSDQHKVEFYEKVMKNRINKIQTDLDRYIKDLKQNHPDDYYFYKSVQVLNEIDKDYD
ncbi:hypothetical protein [Paraliobacillus zengyii]|uniref:hypothetical protein n=1 Tax=Paraliobacillus zengyii TaxID=2213194 RepID=UPI000E3EC082|nr:hypothetical protein [Paraliobacillus zengyii]